MMPTKALTSDRTSIGDCGKSPKPSDSIVEILDGKELCGVAVPNVMPRLGRLRPGKRVSRPPLGLLGSPTSVKFRCTSEGSKLPPGVLVGLSICITTDEMVELCE